MKIGVSQLCLFFLTMMLYVLIGGVSSIQATVILLQDNFDVIRPSIGLIGLGLADFSLATDCTLTWTEQRTAGDGLNRNRRSLQPSFVYLLQFDLRNPDQQFGEGSTNNTVIIGLGSVFNESFFRNGLTDFETITRSISVTNPTSTKLSFDQQGGDNLGVLIDNVGLTAQPVQAIPEP